MTHRYIFLFIYYKRKKKGKKSQLWRYILQCITCLRTTARPSVLYTEILVRGSTAHRPRHTLEKSIAQRVCTSTRQMVYRVIVNYCERFKSLFSTNRSFIWAQILQSLHFTVCFVQHQGQWPHSLGQFQCFGRCFHRRKLFLYNLKLIKCGRRAWCERDHKMRELWKIWSVNEREVWTESIPLLFHKRVYSCCDWDRY